MSDMDDRDGKALHAGKGLGTVGAEEMEDDCAGKAMCGMELETVGAKEMELEKVGAKEMELETVGAKEMEDNASGALGSAGGAAAIVDKRKLGKGMRLLWVLSGLVGTSNCNGIWGSTVG